MKEQKNGGKKNTLTPNPMFLKVTLSHIRPLLQRGLKQVEIAKKLNLHKTTVGKIIKGKIKSSRPIGIKTPLVKRKIAPIWETVGDFYPMVWKTAVQQSYYLKTAPDELADFLLNWLYSRNEKFCKKLAGVKKPHSWLKTCLLAILFERRRNIRKRKTSLVSIDSGIVEKTLIS